jgi:hypothetical protein
MVPPLTAILVIPLENRKLAARKATALSMKDQTI